MDQHINAFKRVISDDQVDVGVELADGDGSEAIWHGQAECQ